LLEKTGINLQLIFQKFCVLDVGLVKRCLARWDIFSFTVNAFYVVA